MQKITFIISIILMSLFFSCKKENKEIRKDLPIATPVDTAAIKDYVDFPVYNLARNTTAIVITMFESDPKADEFQKIYTRINESDSLEDGFYNPKSAKIKKFEFYDTLGIVHLIKSEKLEKEIKKIINPKYYVYGTKGFSEVTVDEVLCRIDDCRENFIALTFKDFDTAKNGKPLFCSTQLLKLNYGKDYFKIQSKIQKMDDSFVYRYSDQDSVKTKVYANIGDAYFVYNDDFIWGTNAEKSKSLFPERRILMPEKNTFKTIRVDGLDIYGKACD